MKVFYYRARSLTRLSTYVSIKGRYRNAMNDFNYTQLLLIETLDNKEALFNPPSYNSNSTLRLSSPDWADKIWLFRRFFHPRNSKPLYIRRPSVGGKVFAEAWIFFSLSKNSFVRVWWWVKNCCCCFIFTLLYYSSEILLWQRRLGEVPLVLLFATLCRDYW